MRPEPVTHPAYGLAAISKLSGSSIGLFGSSVTCNHPISLRISKASVRRDLCTDWYYPEAEIVEIWLSPAQFTEMITSPNSGVGVPCTIRHVGYEYNEMPPIASKREQFTDEVREHAATIAKRLDSLEEFAKKLQDAKTVSKADRKELLERIRMARQEIASNLPFVLDQFNEHADKILSEAKSEFEAFLSQRFIDAGMSLAQAPEAPKKMELT